MIASEVERVRAPERVSETGSADFLRAVLRRELTDREELLGRARELSLGRGRRQHDRRPRPPQAPTDDGWRGRVRAVAERGARAVSGRSIAALSERRDAGAEVLVLVPGGDERPPPARARRSCARWKQAFRATPSRWAAAGSPRIPPSFPGRPAKRSWRRTSRRAPGEDAAGLRGDGRLQAAAVAMSENPGELQRFYAETVEPLVAYDDEYETDLVRTLETFLEADGNVAGTAQRLFTHRHTIYYRLERVRELSGLDVSSSDGREKLSLGLKSMRVLGIASPGGPASEAAPKQVASRVARAAGPEPSVAPRDGELHRVGAPMGPWAPRTPGRAGFTATPVSW